jgi:uncharacterized protein YjbI with pentapeptide repeats
MKTMKTKLALLVSGIVSINLVAGSIPAHAEEIQLRDMHSAEFCSPGVYLAAMDLSYTDFSGCDLTGAHLEDSDFTGANFDGAILRSGYLGHANMAGSFVGADLYGAFANGTTLSGNFERANLSSALAYGATLSGTFSNANLTSTFLSGTNLSGKFYDANFYATELQGAILGGSFARTNFMLIKTGFSTNYLGTQSYPTSFTGDFSSANFSGPGLDGIYTDGNFDDAHFTDSVLNNAHLQGSFQRTNFERTFFSPNTYLEGNFDDARFTDSVLNGAFLQGSFQRSKFERSSFADGFLQGNFDGALFIDEIEQKFLRAAFTGSFVAATFSNAFFYHTNLSQADLSQSNFSAPIGGYFGEATFPKAWPKGWTYCGLYGGYFFGPGQDLSNLTLGNGSFCDVSSVSWTGTNIGNSTFNGQSFIGSDLSELIFSNNRFAQVDFSGVRITRSLSGAYFEQAKFVSSDLTESALDHSTMWAANFSNANLANMDFSQSNVYLSDFSGANLSGVDFSGSTLSGVNFSGANLSGANFTGAKLIDVLNLDCGRTELLSQVSEIRNSEVHGCVFADIGQFRLSGSRFFSSSFRNVTFNNPGINLTGEFYDTEMSDVTFIAIVGGSLKFVGGSLNSVLFQEDSALYNSYFERVTMTDVRFKSGFTQSTFLDMNLRQVKFSNDLNGSIFRNCDLKFANFMESGTRNLTFENSDLSQSNFSGANLDGVNFRDSNLTGTNFNRTSFSGLRTHNILGSPINLNQRYIVRGGYILGPAVMLWGENLRNFDFSGTDLRGAAIFQSEISGAKFARVKSLFGVYSSELTGTPESIADGFAVLKGSIIGPGVSLDSKDFSSINFGSVDLSFASLRNVHLEGADLSKVKFSGTLFCYNFADNSTVAPSGVYIYVSKTPYGPLGSFVGPGIRQCTNGNIWLDSPSWFINGTDVSGRNFEGADLRNLGFRYGDFSRVNLRNANLTSSSLIGSDFTGADLRGANLTNADLGGATLDGALLTGLLGAPAYLPSGWVYSNGSIVREGSQVSGMKLSNSRCAAGNESMSIDSQTHLTLVGDASYASTLSMDTTQGFNAKSSCMVWFIDGAVVPSATKLTYSPGKSDIGKKVRIGVVRTDLSGTKTIQLSDELVVGKAKMNSAAPTVTGISKVGGRLTALRTTWAPGASYTYQWFRSGEAISGATKVSYLPSADDHQHGLSVKVCASKAYFETRCETSSASSPIAAGGFPKSPVVQLVVGKLTVGSILTGKPGNWLAGTSLSFQWLRDGVAIKDATLTSYTLSSEDRGHVIQFQVTASKRGYIDQVKSSIAKSIP